MMKIRVFDEICSIMVESKIVTNVRPALKFISLMFLPIKSLISRSSILFVVVDFSLLFDRVNKRQKGYITHLSFSCLNKKESINTRFFFPIYPYYKQVDLCIFGANLGSGSRISRLYQVTCITLLQIATLQTIYERESLNNFSLSVPMLASHTIWAHY